VALADGNGFGTHRISVSDVDHFEIGDNAWGISLVPRNSYRTITDTLPEGDRDFDPRMEPVRKRLFSLS
jgi:hypothetical protein